MPHCQVLQICNFSVYEEKTLKEHAFQRDLWTPQTRPVLVATLNPAGSGDQDAELIGVVASPARIAEEAILVRLHNGISYGESVSDLQAACGCLGGLALLEGTLFFARGFKIRPLSPS